MRAGVRDVARAQRIFDGKDVPAGVGYTGAKDTPLPPINRGYLPRPRMSVFGMFLPEQGFLT